MILFGSNKVSFLNWLINFFIDDISRITLYVSFCSDFCAQHCLWNPSLSLWVFVVDVFHCGILHWCTIVVLKTLECPLDCKEIKRVNPKRKSTLNIHWKDWCWCWSSNALATCGKSRFIGKDPDARKDWRQKEKGAAEDEMVMLGR